MAQVVRITAVLGQEAHRVVLCEVLRIQFDEVYGGVRHCKMGCTSRRGNKPFVCFQRVGIVFSNSYIVIVNA